jgi:hypothetical protein
MTGKSPPTRRKFADEWDEIDYLYHKLLYWLYEQGSWRKARPFAERLERLLAKGSSGADSIRAEECRSLVCEAKGDLPGAIKHREGEIRLIKRLHDLSSNAPGRDYALRQYGYDDLSDRLDLLATLYHDSDNLDRAISLLRESKELAEAHGVPFDGQDLLDGYLEEKRTVSRAG